MRSGRFYPVSIGSAICLSILVIGEARSETVGGALTPGAFLDFCASKTIADAVSRGQALGWRRVGDAKLKSWKDTMDSTPGVEARAVGFQRGDAEGQGWITFETVHASVQSFHACSFSTDEPTDVLIALRERYGAPDTSDEDGVTSTQFWQRGPIQIATSRVASAVYVRIAVRD